MQRECRVLGLLLLGLMTIWIGGGGARAGSVAPIDAPEPGAWLSGAAGSAAEGFRSPPMLPGWPQTMGTQVLYKPTGVVLADLTWDGDCEVIAGSTDNLIRAWNHDGTLLPGWPVNVGGAVQSKAAVGDLDGDGDQEIVFSTRAGQIRIYHHTGAPLAGWPQSSGLTYGYISPTLYDLDADGIPEVTIGGGSNVRVWRGDGTVFPGFPKAVSGNVTGTLSAGDITGDGVPEILAVTLAGTLEAIQVDGQSVPGWPMSFGLSTSYASATIGDLDGDGIRDALVVGYQFGSYTRIHAYRGTGASLPGFPITYPSVQTYACPVLADGDGDGDLELWNGGKVNGPANFYAWDHAGAALPGWPVYADANLEGSCIVVDFDADGMMEIAVGDNYTPGLILGFEMDGAGAADFPIDKPGASGPNAPEVADVDGDGDLDLAMTSTTGDVAIWGFSSAYAPASVEWGGWFHDNWNTSQFGFVVPGNPAGIEGIAGETPLRLLGAAPNPFQSQTAIRFSSVPGRVARLEILDSAGRAVRVIPAERGSVLWDGRDASGRAVAPGVYFVRLSEESGTKQAVRLVRLR